MKLIWERIFDYMIFQASFKYILILIEGIDVFGFLFQCIVIDLVVLYFYSMGRVPSILVSIDGICWALVFLWFYMKRCFKIFVLKVLIPHYFSYLYMRWMIQKRLVQDLREVKYVGCILRMLYLLRCDFWKWRKGFIVYCDAYRVGLGCVLMQHGKVISYASR